MSLYNKTNIMSFFLFFSHLSIFFIAEKILIVRIYVFVNLRLFKKYQYKYSKHMINFMQNTTKIINKFSNLSFELQMLILKSTFFLVKKKRYIHDVSKNVSNSKKTCIYLIEIFDSKSLKLLKYTNQLKQFHAIFQK